VKGTCWGGGVEQRNEFACSIRILILSHVDPLLGNYSEISGYKTPGAR
jgi:hypothetical protein